MVSNGKMPNDSVNVNRVNLPKVKKQTESNHKKFANMREMMKQALVENKKREQLKIDDMEEVIKKEKLEIQKELEQKFKKEEKEIKPFYGLN